MSECKTDKKIIDEAPAMAVTYCYYGYGDDMSGCYLNCEKEFFDDETRRWVDMGLVDNCFHSRRRIDDIRNIVHLQSRIASLEERDINQGCGDDIEILRVDGDREGVKLPTSIMLKNKKTGEVAVLTQ